MMTKIAHFKGKIVSIRSLLIFSGSDFELVSKISKFSPKDTILNHLSYIAKSHE